MSQEAHNDSDMMLVSRADMLALNYALRESESIRTELALARGRASTAEGRNEILEREVRRLEHQLGLLHKRLFGQSSEKLNPDQLPLFIAEQLPKADDDAGPLVSHDGKKRRPPGHGRSTFPAHLPRQIKELDPLPADRKCDECGDPLCRVSEQTSEKGEYIPGRFVVNRYVRGVWACKKNHGGVKMADAPKGIKGRGRFEPSVYAQIIAAKYGDHLPLYRQAGIFERTGFTVAATTMSDMMGDAALLLVIILKEMKRQLFLSRFIQADDTPVNVFLEKGKTGKKKKLKKGRLWVFIGLGDIIVYDFQRTWERAGPINFLDGSCATHFQGDRYKGYPDLCAKHDFIKVVCWAHIRRKFFEAKDEDANRSEWVLLGIRRLYRIEKRIREWIGKPGPIDREKAFLVRKRLGTFVIKQIERRLRSYEESQDVTPASALGRAVAYALNQWDDVHTYLHDLEITPDNNAAERALRGVAVGRKNYLFFGGEKGGETAATLYSLIASCKALDLDPYAYLKDVLERLVQDRDTSPEELTPWAWRDAQAKKLVAEVQKDLAVVAEPEF